MARRQTPSQTVGPYFAYGLTPQQYGFDYPSVVTTGAHESAAGERIVITGQVLDGDGQAIEDAMLEFWQADATGHYVTAARPHGDNRTFTGFARVGTGVDPDARYRLETIKPGATGVDQAPHVNVIVYMRGLLTHLYTRAYFEDEHQANAADRVLNTVAAQRRATLIATLDPPGPEHYRFDVHMQGDRETVFFDV